MAVGVAAHDAGAARLGARVGDRQRGHHLHGRRGAPVVLGTSAAPDWPKCTQTSAVAAHSAGQTTLNTAIEFSNRTLNFPLVAIAGLTFIAFLRYYQRSGRARKDLVWLSAVLPLGVVAQAVVGGIVVLTKLNPAMVAAHFLLSTAIILTSAVVLHNRAAARSIAGVAHAGVPEWPPPAPNRPCGCSPGCWPRSPP